MLRHDFQLCGEVNLKCCDAAKQYGKINGLEDESEIKREKQGMCVIVS
jgi:hypothetical protein